MVLMVTHPASTYQARALQEPLRGSKPEGSSHNLGQYTEHISVLA